MSRFVSRPGVVVEAHQYDGNPLPMTLAGCVLQRRADGGLEVRVADGTRHCKLGDWVIRDRDGQYSVMRDAAFEVMFEPQGTQQPQELERVKRPYNRRSLENA